MHKISEGIVPKNGFFLSHYSKKNLKAIFVLFIKKISAARKFDENRFSLFWENFESSEYEFGLLKQRSQTFRKKIKNRPNENQQIKGAWSG